MSLLGADLRPEEDQRMLRCKAIGDNHIKLATRDITEIKERMRVITEKIAQEEDADETNDLEQIVTRLESALDAARMGQEYMNVSRKAAYDMIGKKPSDKEGKIKKIKKYECRMCSFNTNNDKRLKDHVREYHRPKRIRGVSDTSQKNIKLACCAWNKFD